MYFESPLNAMHRIWQCTHMHMYVAPHIDFPFELTFAATITFVDRLSFHYNINCRQNMPDTLFNGTKMTEQKNYTLEAAGKNITHKKIEKATTWASNINETVSDIKIAIFVVWPSLASIFTYLAIVYLCFCFCFVSFYDFILFHFVVDRVLSFSGYFFVRCIWNCIVPLLWWCWCDIGTIRCLHIDAAWSNTFKACVIGTNWLRNEENE